MTKQNFLARIKLKTLGLAAGGLLVLAAPIGVVQAQGDHYDGGSSRKSYQRHSWDHQKRQFSWWHKYHHDDTDKLTCEERQAKVDQKVADYKTAAQAKLDSLSAYLANQQAYVEQNGIEVENYDSMVQKATEAQTNLTEEINTLEAPTVDCDKSQKYDRKLLKRALSDMREAKSAFTHAVVKLSLSIIAS